MYEPFKEYRGHLITFCKFSKGKLKGIPEVKINNRQKKFKLVEIFTKKKTS